MLEAGDEAGYQKLINAIDVSPDLAYKLII